MDDLMVVPIVELIKILLPAAKLALNPMIEFEFTDPTMLKKGV